MKILFPAAILLTVFMAPIGALRAQLADKSPFLPAAGAAVSPVAADNNSVELRGIMSTAEGTRFCIYDATKKTSQWVGLNEDGPIVVKSADSEHDTVSVVKDGRQMTLALRTPKVAAGTNIPQPQPQPAFSPPAPAGGFAPAPALTNVVLKPTPEDEQRRLQAIADEVRRRRLLREQGQQQQPGAPGSATAQPPGNGLGP